MSEMKKPTRIESDYAYHPGRLLAEEVEERGTTYEELEVAMQLPPGALRAIAEERQPVTADIALRMERVLGSPARAWLRLQGEYDLTIARQAMREAG